MIKFFELVQKGKSLQRRVARLAEDDPGEGVWRTVRGRRIFIGKGESFDDALKKSLDGIKTDGGGGGGGFSEGKTALTVGGGWITTHDKEGGAGIEYGKYRPLRGSSYYFMKAGGKERKFKDYNSRGSPEDQLKKAVEKIGAKYTRPSQEQTARPKITSTI